MSKAVKILKIVGWVAPLAIAILWILKIIFFTSAPDGSLLAPVNSAPIVVSLIVFLFGYSVFLVLMFYSDIKEMFHKSR